MNKRSDYHIHTNLCDGKDSPAAMAETARKLGFHTLGFTGHSPMLCPGDWCMDDLPRYHTEIRALQARYAGEMRILCGLERDYFFAPGDDFPYDYVIGSVHAVEKDGVYYAVDDSADALMSHLDRGFGGSYDAFCEAYYAQVADVLRKTNADIIGHLDLVTKFRNKLHLTESDRYLKAAFEAIHALIPAGKPFEINVGAITRGYRTSPYPSDALLREIHACGGTIILTGDCHNRENLGDCWDVSVEAAKRAGFTTRMEWGNGAFEEVPL